MRATPVERSPVDLAELVEEAVEVVTEQPVAGGVSVSVNLPRAPRPLPTVPGDADLLGLALVNLVEDAVRYTPSGGTVEVRAREDGGTVVADSAPGRGLAVHVHRPTTR